MKKIFQSKRTEKAFNTALNKLKKLDEIPLDKIPVEWKEDFMAWLPENRPYKGNGMAPVSQELFTQYLQKLEDKGLSYRLKFKLPSAKKKKKSIQKKYEKKK